MRKSFETTELQDIIARGYSPDDPEDVKKLERLQRSMTDREKSDVEKIVGKKLADAVDRDTKAEEKRTIDDLIERGQHGENVFDQVARMQNKKELTPGDAEKIRASINQKMTPDEIAVRFARTAKDAVEAFDKASDQEKENLIVLINQRWFNAKAGESKAEYESRIAPYKDRMPDLIKQRGELLKKRNAQKFASAAIQ